MGVSSLPNPTNQNLHHKLQEIVLHQSELMQRLVYLQHICTEAYLCAGAIRNLVWALLHQQHNSIGHGEIDIVFFDPNEKNQQTCHEIEQKMTDKFPENEWDVVNQALVHTWYKTEMGNSISPYTSLIDALMTWPETATAVAIRLNQNNEIEIIAPFGLDDLFELKLRWNPRLVSHEVFMQRVTSKRFLERWKNLKMLP